MKALIRASIVAVVLAAFSGIAAPAAAQHASVEVRIGGGGYHRHYGHGHRAHARYHRHYTRHYRRPVVVVAPGRHYYRYNYGYRPHASRYYRWY